MPQVQVALRALASGKHVRVNDVISYITCLPSSAPDNAEKPASTFDIDSSTPAPKRAFSLLDLTKSTGALKPDVEWYLSKQIFPPIERLCAPIPGTDAGQLAECLGLDPKKYAAFSRSDGSSGSGSSGLDFAPLDSQLPDSLRYSDCPRLHLTCLKCRHKFEFDGLASSASKDYASPKGLKCPLPECAAPFRTLSLVCQVESQIRQLASKYYEGWLLCDEPTCGARTRSMSVYGHRCLGPQGLARGCLGRMHWEVSGKLVGNTLGYWRGLWDPVRVPMGGLSGAEELERVRALRTFEVRECMGAVKGVLEGYERKCGWVWVAMDGLFGWALK